MNEWIAVSESSIIAARNVRRIYYIIGYAALSVGRSVGLSINLDSIYHQRYTSDTYEPSPPVLLVLVALTILSKPETDHHREEIEE